MGTYTVMQENMTELYGSTGGKGGPGGGGPAAGCLMKSLTSFR